MALSDQAREKYYNLCNPDEALPAGDARNVDLDDLGDAPGVRGDRWIDTIATEIRLSRKPVCRFFTGLPGSGKSTELRRLQGLLEKRDGPDRLVVYIEAEAVLDLNAPIDVPDIWVALLYETERCVLRAERRDPDGALGEGLLARLWHWLDTTELDIAALEVAPTSTGTALDLAPGLSATAGLGGKLVLALREQPSFRQKARKRIADHVTTFVRLAGEEMSRLDARAKKAGRKGLVVLFDSLEKLRGITSNWVEVLQSAERLFAGPAPFVQLPVPVVYTIPPALILRQNVRASFMPMIKLYDREGARYDAGFRAARALVEKRIPPGVLTELLGATSLESRLERLLAWSGGYPREIVRLLQLLLRQRTVDDRVFEHVLGSAGDDYRRTIPATAYELLASIAVDHDLHAALVSPESRELADQLLSNNVVLCFHNGEEWFDLHPAIRSVKGIQIAVEKLRAAREAPAP
jgi:hypothetical protein